MEVKLLEVKTTITHVFKFDGKGVQAFVKDGDAVWEFALVVKEKLLEAIKEIGIIDAEAKEEGEPGEERRWTGDIKKTVVYVFRCKGCGHRAEKLQSEGRDIHNIKCPTCSSTDFTMDGYTELGEGADEEGIVLPELEKFHNGDATILHNFRCRECGLQLKEYVIDIHTGALKCPECKSKNIKADALSFVSKPKEERTTTIKEVCK